MLNVGRFLLWKYSVKSIKKYELYSWFYFYVYPVKNCMFLKFIHNQTPKFQNPKPKFKLGKTVKSRNLKILQNEKHKKTETVLYFLKKTETGKFRNRASSIRNLMHVSFDWWCITNCGFQNQDLDIPKYIFMEKVP